MPRKSINAYPTDWDEIALAIKAKAGWHCIRCGHAHDPENGYTLTVHHLDLNPANNEWWNTPALCQRCHLTIQGKVVMERYWMFRHSAWFMPYAAGYYAFINNLPHDYDYVIDHLEELLTLGRPR